MALSKGDKILKIYKVWHFFESRNELFRSYVRKNYKINTEASEWPKECKTEQQKNEYINFFKDKYNIELDINNIKNEKNQGMRTVAKLCLNSLWGKFGERLDEGETV